MMSFLQWLDTHPVAHGLTAWGCFALGLASALSPSRPAAPSSRAPFLGHPAVFASLLLLTLLAFRWPSWFAPVEFNPDESQIVAGALTLQSSPVFWKYVDGTTHGPLNEYALNLAALFGLPLTHAGARAMATLLLAGTLICLWQTLRPFLAEPAVRLAVFPALCVWAFSWAGDYVHYSSELVAVSLLAGAGWALTAMLRPQAPSRTAPLVAGALLALVPLAKLQATPLALVLGLAALSTLVWSRPAGWVRLAAGLVGGALLVGAGLGLFLVVYGLEAQFWYSYVVSNLAYAGSRDHPLHDMPNYFWSFLTTGQSFAWFFYGTMAYVLYRAHAVWQAADVTRRRALLAAWLLVLLAYLCVIYPGRRVAHYLHLLVGPLTLLAGLHLASPPTTGRAFRGIPASLLAVLLLLTVLPQAVNRWLAVPFHPGQLAEHLATPASAAARHIQARSQPGDLLTVWGWEPRLHVETQLAQGTREAHSAFQLFAGPMQDFYRSRYLRDLQARQPAWFVDATGPGAFVFDAARHGHEIFPALQTLIAERYALQAQIGSTRIYHLKSPH
ncbi:hypothetical protein Verru16b_02010 [Lacunisphaera limnophila]|uniref:Glycosyltransferase RgtA/B/C/D-like domain-containing protein n=1 Tax=Lacunisphaera limnophila TaxID=1838286 RepID=A0A1D8AVP1_9BACT|nr:hypothetical protein [Lacunisphaera limnophila]AOS44941.1 hypothetical protein Verru16b_02010 [Lacunisphaera limnophila]